MNYSHVLPAPEVPAPPAWKSKLEASGSFELPPASLPASEPVSLASISRVTTPSGSVNGALEEAVEGLAALTKGMSAATKEAAFAWCIEADIPSVELMIEAKLDVDFISHLALKPGGAQDITLRKRLASAAQ